MLGDRRSALDDAGRLGVDGERADRADDVDAEVAEEATVLRRQHRLDEIVRQLLERDRVVVFDAALADLDAVAILKGHGEVAALQPVVVRGFLEGRHGQRQHDEEAGEPERQTFAGELDEDAQRAGKMQPVGRGVEAPQDAEYRLAGVEHRQIDERVESEQRPRRRASESLVIRDLGTNILDCR